MCGKTTNWKMRNVKEKRGIFIMKQKAMDMKLVVFPHTRYILLYCMNHGIPLYSSEQTVLSYDFVLYRSPCIPQQLFHFTKEDPYEENQCNLRKAVSGQSR